ncbi:FecR family protein [Chitinophaga sp. SYP-B3965]|uniref:FecR family protein n=1 Tax=Chitinophaga sp. SYP-B3965 TaxID=2663120 RepID=UPI0015675B86|nr:FecR family protein [Chitinophaga sp. SYP-B3965]
MDQLIAEEIAGTITPADKYILDKAIAEDPEVRALWLARHQLFEAQGMKEWLKKKREFSMKKKAGTPVRRMILYTTSGVAALVIVAFMITSNMKLGQKTPAWQNLVKENGRKFELKLANGEVLDLREYGQSTINGVTFNRQAHSLAFSTNGSKEEGQLAVFRVPVGEYYEMLLPEGTRILLNSATTVEFNTSFAHSSKREITINGQAFLNVAKEENRPFIVHLPKMSVKVLGTAFDVNSYDEGKNVVALVQGSVKLEAGNKSAILSQAGSLATYTGEGEIQKGHFDEEDLLSWRRGEFRFNDMTLEELCKVFPRWFEQKVVIDNAKMKTEVFTGMLEKKKGIVQNLTNLGVKNVSVDKDSIVHIK